MKLRFITIVLVLGFLFVTENSAHAQFAPWGTGMNMAYPQCPYDMGGGELYELNAAEKEAKNQWRKDQKELKRLRDKVGVGKRADYNIDFASNNIKSFFITLLEQQKDCAYLTNICNSQTSESKNQGAQAQATPCTEAQQITMGNLPNGCDASGGIDYNKLCENPKNYNDKTGEAKNDLSTYISECKNWVKDYKETLQDVKESQDAYNEARTAHKEAEREQRQEERESRREARRSGEPVDSCVNCYYGRRREQKVDKLALGVGVVMDYLMMRANRSNVKTISQKNAELGWGTDPSITNPWYGFGYGFPFATMAALSGGRGGFYGGVYGGIGGGAWGCAGVGGLASPYGPAGFMTPYGPYMNPYGQVPGIWGGGGIGMNYPGYNPALAMGFMPGYPPWGMAGPWAGASAGVGIGMPGFPFGLAAGAGIGMGMPFGGYPMMGGMMGPYGMMGGGNPGLLAGGIGLGGLPYGMAGGGMMGMPYGGLGMGGMGGMMPPFGMGGMMPPFGMGGMGGMGGPFGGSVFGPGSGLGMNYQMQMYQMQMQMQQQYMQMYERQMQNQMMQYQALQQVSMEMATLQQRYYQIMYGGFGVSGGFGAGFGGAAGPFGNTPTSTTNTNGPFSPPVRQ